jgi:hypothetical protein
VPDHPDHEELAAWQAGALDEPDQGRTAAHVAGCPDCGAVIGALEGARQRLAVLDEPELPAGFHDRLAAAVESEQARRAPRRRPAWYQRPATWSAAAAVLLFVAGAFGFIRLTTSGSDGGGTSAAAHAPAQAEGSAEGRSGTAGAGASEGRADRGGLTEVRLPGEFSPAKLRAAMSVNTKARDALQQARSSGWTLQSGKDHGLGVTMERAAPGQPAPPPADQACLDRIASAGTVRPAFVAISVSNGRVVKILVAYVGDPPREVRYWAFPATGCTGAPLFSGVAVPAS